MIDALVDSSIRFVTTRDERGAAFMADTYGALTGKPGVCLATLGPGRDQPDARDRERAARLPSARRHHGAGRARPHLQGVAPVRRHRVAVPAHHQMGRHGDACRWRRRRWSARRSSWPRPNGRAPRSSSCPRTSRSCRARARRCPSTCRAIRRPPRIRSTGPRTSSSRPKHPVVLAGPGIARDGAVDALIRFSERLNLPVATTFLGKGVFPDDHPERARDDRVHGPGLRELRVRPRRRGRGRRLRPGGVLAGALEPEPGQADRAHPPHASPRSTRTTRSRSGSRARSERRSMPSPGRRTCTRSPERCLRCAVWCMRSWSAGRRMARSR